jgi:hypothetical protein
MGEKIGFIRALLFFIHFKLGCAHVMKIDVFTIREEPISQNHVMKSDEPQVDPAGLVTSENPRPTVPRKGPGTGILPKIY